MGGLGSGAKWDKKSTVESRQCLDVRRLHREHGLTPGSEMTIKYEWREEQIAQKIFLDWTPCNYGGYRPWFVCMDCGRKVAKIYFGGKNFACRHCLNLTYTSCQESDSRFSRFFRNNGGFGGVENMPLWALKGFLNRILKEKEWLKKQMKKRRRGRPPKKAPEG